MWRFRVRRRGRFAMTWMRGKATHGGPAAAGAFACVDMGRAWVGWAGVVAISVVGTLLHDTRRPDARFARLRGSHAVAREVPAARLAPSRAAVAAQLEAPTGLAPTTDASAWQYALRAARSRDPDVLVLLRERVDAALVALVHPTAPWSAGSAPLRVAAEVADEGLCERLLGLLEVYQRVVLKLPLTHGRDDLVLLDAVAGAVRRAGNPSQRRRLDRWLRAAGSEDVDEETRARLRVWAEGEEP